MSYCVSLTVKDLSRCLNETESVGFTKTLLLAPDRRYDRKCCKIVYISLPYIMAAINRNEEILRICVTYDGDFVDGCAVVQQQRGAVDVVALCRHVQRSEAVLRLRRQLSVMVDQHLDDGAVAAATGAVQRRQTVLSPAPPSALCIHYTNTWPK